MLDKKPSAVMRSKLAKVRNREPRFLFHNVLNQEFFHLSIDPYLSCSVRHHIGLTVSFSLSISIYLSLSLPSPLSLSISHSLSIYLSLPLSHSLSLSLSLSLSPILSSEGSISPRFTWRCNRWTSFGPCNAAKRRCRSNIGEYLFISSSDEKEYY